MEVVVLRKEREEALKALEKRLALSFSSLELLNMALTHQTYVFEHPQENLANNQRLEFLGDSILNFLTAEELYKRYPSFTEGELSKMRAVLVCEPTLSSLAEKIGLGEYILLGKGEKLSGGAKRSSLLADAFEALLAAIYLEFGLETTRIFLLKQLKPILESSLELVDLTDYKTNLQELVQKEFGKTVSYKIIKESGPDHDKRFVAATSIDGTLLATGEGKSKKDAQQKAAAKALAKLRQKADY